MGGGAGGYWASSWALNWRTHLAWMSPGSPGTSWCEAPRMTPRSPSAWAPTAGLLMWQRCLSQECVHVRNTTQCRARKLRRLSYPGQWAPFTAVPGTCPAGPSGHPGCLGAFGSWEAHTPCPCCWDFFQPAAVGPGRHMPGTAGSGSQGPTDGSLARSGQEMPGLSQLLVPWTAKTPE